MPRTFNFCFNEKRKSKISPLVTANLNSVAIRFPKHKIVRSIIKSLNFPIAMPSANISSRLSPVTAEDVYEEFKNKLTTIINGGKAKIGIESTVIDLTEKPKILRPGIISANEIKNF